MTTKGGYWPKVAKQTPKKRGKVAKMRGKIVIVAQLCKVADVAHILLLDLTISSAKVVNNDP
jgi:hypothetical protein